MSTNDPARPDRRGFLRGLTALPLIGGGVTLIGNPTAAAVPPTPELLRSYSDWLQMEQRYLVAEHGRDFEFIDPNSPGGRYHWRAYGTADLPTPSTRAAIVLSAVGCDWRQA